MKSSLVGLLSESHVHVGVGQSEGPLDLPVARERGTDFLFVPGSAVKGAFRVWAVEHGGLKEQARTLFGEAGASELVCSDARLLLLPACRLSEAYRWITCPTILNRLNRDLARTGLTGELAMANVTVANGTYLGAEGWLGLEERGCRHAGAIDPAVIGAVSPLIPHAGLCGILPERLVVLSDTDFAWFARLALPIRARIGLDENKLAKQYQLWQEETLPPNTVLYLLFVERKGRSGAVETLKRAVAAAPHIQIGHNKGVGQGWFLMAEYGAARAASA